MPFGGLSSRSPKARRNAWIAAAALRSERLLGPKFEGGPVSVAAIASPTTAGVWVPPGPSKWAIPEARDGNFARRAAMSRDMRAPQAPSGDNRRSEWPQQALADRRHRPEVG